MTEDRCAADETQFLKAAARMAGGIACAVVLLVAAGPGAQAEVITQTATFVYTAPATTTFFPVFAQFDPSLGTLQQVEIAYDLTGALSITVQNTFSAPAGFSPDVHFFTNFSNSDFADVTDQEFGLIGPLAPGGVGSTTVTNTLMQSFLASDLAPFIGLGDFDARIRNSVGASFAISPTSYSGGGSVSVVYTYSLSQTAIPEPEILALFAAAVAVLRAKPARRRRRER